jgi:hypothetical protein
MSRGSSSTPVTILRLNYHETCCIGYVVCPSTTVLCQNMAGGASRGHHGALG